MGATWAETALIAKDSGHELHYSSAKESSEKASKTVGRFMDLVNEGPIRSKIAKQVGEFDSLISKL